MGDGLRSALHAAAARYTGKRPMNRGRLESGKSPWYRIENHAEANAADVWIYDEIGIWGLTASDFVRELAGVVAEVLHVHLNTPGGEIFDGIAIFNALQSHSARVEINIEGLAASIGSVIAMAGDSIKIAPNAQMMIHEGQGFCMGDAADMAAMSALLDKASDNIASVYAARVGGTVAEWRALMKEETWFSAKEALAAGLVDEVTSPPAKPEPAAQNTWDLSIFRYAGRDAAPSPEAVLVLSIEPAEPDPVEVRQEWAALDLEAFRAGVASAVRDPVIPFDPDVFRNLMRAAGNDVAAPTAVVHDQSPAPDEPVAIDPLLFRHALRRATA